jgi:triphosphatase
VETLYRLAGALLATAPLWLMSESKASRGWRLRTGQGAGAQPKLPLRFKRKLCADAGFRQIFGATLGHLTANIGPTLRCDPEGLHQARIAIREARAVLQLFDPYLDADGAGRFTETLRTYGQILGAARDWDVLCLETLPGAMPNLSSERLEDLNSAVERQLAHAAVAAALQGRGFSKMVLGLVSWSYVCALALSENDADLTRRQLSTLAPSLLDRARRRCGVAVDMSAGCRKQGAMTYANHLKNSASTSKPWRRFSARPTMRQSRTVWRTSSSQPIGRRGQSRPALWSTGTACAAAKRSLASRWR